MTSIDREYSRDVVLNTGFISAEEAVRLYQEAKGWRVERIIVPAVN